MSDHPLIALCRSKGNDARDIRDAAHEAYHAISVGARKWERETVHRKMMRSYLAVNAATLWLHEMRARAVEQIVSKHYGYDAGTLEHWVSTSIMEAIKHGLPFAEYDASLAAAERFMRDVLVNKAAREIIAMASKPIRKRRAAPNVVESASNTNR